MNGLIMAGQLLLGLSLLVILHELGHFLAARAFGIKVEKRSEERRVGKECPV